jgi:hypothetical protein
MTAAEYATWTSAAWAALAAARTAAKGTEAAAWTAAEAAKAAALGVEAAAWAAEADAWAARAAKDTEAARAARLITLPPTATQGA